MIRRVDHRRLLLAVQAAIAVGVLAAVSPRLAIVSGSAAGAVILTRQRASSALTVSIVTAVAVVAVLTVPPGAARRQPHPDTALRIDTHRRCGPPRAQVCRHG